MIIYRIIGRYSIFNSKVLIFIRIEIKIFIYRIKYNRVLLLSKRLFCFLFELDNKLKKKN